MQKRNLALLSRQELVRVHAHLLSDMRGYVKSYNEDKEEAERIERLLRRK
jgi:hypothetical protein